VRTLHGLAHDIVRERPALVNLANDFQIVDEREAQFILQEAAEAWVSATPCRRRLPRRRPGRPQARLGPP